MGILNDLYDESNLFVFKEKRIKLIDSRTEKTNDLFVFTLIFSLDYVGPGTTEIMGDTLKKIFGLKNVLQAK